MYEWQWEKGEEKEEQKEKEESADNKEAVEARARIGNETQCSVHIILVIATLCNGYNSHLQFVDGETKVRSG